MSFVCQSWHKENVRPAKLKVLNAFLFGLEFTVNYGHLFETHSRHYAVYLEQDTLSSAWFKPILFQLHDIHT